MTNRGSTPAIPYKENPYWQEIEAKVFDILKKATIEISQFQTEFVSALIQAQTAVSTPSWRGELEKLDPPIVSKDWRTAAISTSAIALTVIWTRFIVPMTANF